MEGRLGAVPPRRPAAEPEPASDAPPKRRHGKSGRPRDPAVIVYASPARYARWRAAAEAEGCTSYAEWARAVQDARADEILGALPDD